MIAPPKPPPGVAIAAAIGLAIYAFTIGGSSRSSGATPTGSPVASLCRTSQITSNLDIPDGITVLTAWLMVRNRSNTPCSLPLRAPTARITWRGTALPAHELHGRDLVDASWEPIRIVRVLQPNQRAAINFDWKNFCGPQHRSSRAIPTYHFWFDRRLRLSAPFGPEAICMNPGAPSTILVSRPILARS